MEIKKGMFMLDGEVYHGYTTGQTWNGWEWPLLPETETLRFLNDYCRLANEVNDLGEDEGAVWEKHLNDSYELWDMAEDKENHIVGFTAEGGDYTYNGETIHLYDCGGTYCWEWKVIETAYRAQSDLVKKMYECLDLCETQIETSGGDGQNEILSGITLADIKEMRNVIGTLLADGLQEIEEDRLPEITADDLRDYQGR